MIFLPSAAPHVFCGNVKSFMKKRKRHETAEIHHRDPEKKYFRFFNLKKLNTESTEKTP
jgi:hypothetical protein